MRLFAWQPKGHGSLSFFTIAENKEQALIAVQKYINKLQKEGQELPYEASGWGTDYYELTILEVGDVAVNAND